MMKHSFNPISLMLNGITLFHYCLALKPYDTHHNLGHWRLAARDPLSPTSTIGSFSATISPCMGTSCVGARPIVNHLPCTSANGTTILAGSTTQLWTMLCDIDFYAQDIFPFVSAGTFEKCLKHCDDHNQKAQNTQCVGFVFAPDRVGLENDCYLKSSTNNVVSPSTIHLIGATLVPTPGSVVGASASSASGSPNEAGKPIAFVGIENLQVKVLGTSISNPTKQYVSHLPAPPMKLTSKLLKPGINIDLVTKYPLAGDTGSWTQTTASSDFELSNLTSTPRLSRDGGKGGNINGTHIFYFCDTSTFGDIEGPLGYMNGFVSSSAAVDVSRKAAEGKALELQDPIGQWQDDVGRLRGWIPMTTGEESFNIAISGQGYRYAVWPESSFIQLNGSHSLIYAPIVYVEVDMKTQHAEFTSLGNTLVAVSIDDVYGPHADRIVKQMFRQDEVEWGSLGGFRAWTKTGQGTNDGMVYLFGQVEGGILAAKVPAIGITDRSAYLYWNGAAWSTQMPGKNSTAYVVNQPVMDVDIFYVPACHCFVMIYLTPFADNTFYLRRLLADHPIIPPYMAGGSDDYAENLLRYPWSEPRVLYQPPVPAEGYIYAGGCHLGYFGYDDLANGGSSLLITWTEHTTRDPNDPASGYAHKSIVLH